MNHPLKKVLKAKLKRIPTQKVLFCHCHITIAERTDIKIKILRVSTKNFTSYHRESNLIFEGFAWQQNYRTGNLKILMGTLNMEYGVWNMEYGIWNMAYGIRDTEGVNGIDLPSE